ncbi:MAG TPA: hypothetical protein VFQ55_18940 [Casimicrobiaceae bacterium]|jgi:hypothetical protein|nr:hypothetical protein [Casimicrobiaceae bacterium]
MKITAQFAFWASLVFAAACLAYAAVGFTSIDASMTPTQQSDARGFAWFWALLGSVGLVSAVVAGLMARGRLGSLDE